MKHRPDSTALMKRADQRLAKLEEALALAPEQRAAWDEFSSTMRGKAAQSTERVEAMRNRERASTALERLERMEEFGKERLESMQEMRKVVTALYAQLDEGQKKTFDEQFRFAGPRHRGDRRQGPGRTERSPGA
ncbi:Spy/CpxP family protein refolding chaperone [Aromatoleum sp.]|uniref:Spy/CpxP family protein refolding chaperone n=1 Tax=Aromatoleum sp. TaxID=2307007 RepID=UPI002FC7B33E